MHWSILWIGNQESGAIVQSLQSLLGWSSIQAGRTRICWRIDRSLLTHSWNVCIWHELTIWHIVVSKQACKISLEMDSGMWRKMSKADFLLHHTIDYRQCCQVENTAQHCRLGLFQDSDFAGDFEDSKSASGGILSLCVLSQRGPKHATSI